MMSARKLGDTRQLRQALGRFIGLMTAETEGQDLVECGLLASLIAIASAGAVSAFGVSVFGLWSRIVADLSSYFS
jgi:Flp pilus assembly pilin Flp